MKAVTLDKIDMKEGMVLICEADKSYWVTSGKEYPVKEDMHGLYIVYDDGDSYLRAGSTTHSTFTIKEDTPEAGKPLSELSLKAGMKLLCVSSNSKYFTAGKEYNTSPTATGIIDEEGDTMTSARGARFTIVRETKEEGNTFTKADLKDGMLVINRSGDRYLSFAECFSGGSQFGRKSDYNDDLTHKNHSALDILSVYSVKGILTTNELLRDNINLSTTSGILGLVWQREELSPTQLAIREKKEAMDKLQAQIDTLEQEVVVLYREENS